MEGIVIGREVWVGLPGASYPTQCHLVIQMPAESHPRRIQMDAPALALFRERQRVEVREYRGTITVSIKD